MWTPSINGQQYQGNDQCCGGWRQKCAAKKKERTYEWKTRRNAIRGATMPPLVDRNRQERQIEVDERNQAAQENQDW